MDGLWKARVSLLSLFFVALKADFRVETVESDICDMVVENFAEIGENRRLFYALDFCAQPVETVLHNSVFLSGIRIFRRFLFLLSKPFPQRFR